MRIRRYDTIVVAAAVAAMLLILSDVRVGYQSSGTGCQQNVEDAARRVVERTDSMPIKDMVVKAATLCGAGRPDDANRVLDQVDQALRSATSRRG